MVFPCQDFLYAGATTLAPTPAGKEQLGLHRLRNYGLVGVRV